jgi:hypothetical protein
VRVKEPSLRDDSVGTWCGLMNENRSCVLCRQTARFCDRTSAVRPSLDCNSLMNLHAGPWFFDVQIR